MSQRHTVTPPSPSSPSLPSSSSPSTSTPLDTVAAVEDPRVDESYCEFVPRVDGPDLLLVGVVHDHPASVARVRAVVRATTPDTLALELPTASLPYYRRCAERGDWTADETPPGGEMSAAVDVASETDVVGIDPLDGRFLAAAGRELVEGAHSVGTVRSVAERSAGIARRIARQRLAASSVGRAPTLDEPTEYGCEPESPAEQAAHEADHVSRCAVLRTATERPPAVEVVTTARERRMAERLAELDGDLAVAVVGWAHLDALVERLRRSERGERPARDR